jgi:hypothetical protein
MMPDFCGANYHETFGTSRVNDPEKKRQCMPPIIAAPPFSTQSLILNTVSSDYDDDFLGKGVVRQCTLL